MQQVKNRRDSQALDLVHDLVGKAPVVLADAEMHRVIRQAVAQYLQAEGLDQLQILAPMGVMTAFIEHVAAHAAVRDGGIRALDASREHEVARAPCGQPAAIGAAGAAVAVAFCLAILVFTLDDRQKTFFFSHSCS